MSSTPMPHAVMRLADTGYGIILNSLVQALLNLKSRPQNPSEWILRKLKDAQYFINEDSLLAFLRSAVETAATRCEQPTHIHESHVNRPAVSALAQQLVILTCDLSTHYKALHDGRLMAEATLMTFASLVADFSMWEVEQRRRHQQQLGGSGGDSGGNGGAHRAPIRLTEYVLLTSAALRLVHTLRTLAAPQRQIGQDLTTFDAIFDLAEVLLKLRCFAAQADVDCLGDRWVDFAEDSGDPLGWSVASQRPFRVVFVQPFARSRDGVVPVTQRNAVQTLENMFDLVRRLSSNAGFPNVVIHCVVTEFQPPQQTTRDLFRELQVRTEPASEALLRSALEPLQFVESEIASGNSVLTFRDVTVVTASSAFPPSSGVHVPSAFGNADGSTSCTSRMCRTLAGLCGAASTAAQAEAPPSDSMAAAAADVAPPCVVLLPVDSACSVLSAPLLVVVGIALAEHIGSVLRDAVPTYSPSPASIPSPSSAAVAADDKKKKASTVKGASPAPASNAVPGGAPTQAAAGQQGAAASAAPGTNPSTLDVDPLVPQPYSAASRRVGFGEGYHLLFGEGTAQGQASASTSDSGVGGTARDAVPTFLVLLLKPLSGTARTRAQNIGSALLALALSEVCAFPPTYRPGAQLSLPMIGAVACGYGAALARHTSHECWWRLLGETSPRAPLANTDFAVDVPLVKSALALHKTMQRLATLRYATALIDSYRRIATHAPTPEVSAATPSPSPTVSLPIVSILDCFFVTSPGAIPVPAAPAGPDADAAQQPASPPSQQQSASPKLKKDAAPVAEAGKSPAGNPQRATPLQVSRNVLREKRMIASEKALASFVETLVMRVPAEGSLHELAQLLQKIG